MNTEPFKNEESLREENEFLKMKLMLETGGQFGSMDNRELPAEIENMFLKNIMEYEKQFQSHKTIKLYDKINRPTHFRQVAEIPDEEIENVLSELQEYLHQHGVSLSVCSPNIPSREIYRFAVEELFEQELVDFNMPGMMNCFTYDEFYPDHKYENTRIALEDCIGAIFEKEPFKWMLHFRKDNLRLNEHDHLTENEFMKMINRFKEAYEDISVDSMEPKECIIHEKNCSVDGEYSIIAVLQNENISLQGKWKVEFELDEDLDYWYIVNVNIDGIKF